MIYRNVNQTDLVARKEKHEKIHFNTMFKFLQDHKGIRRGCTSALIGTTGSGKSTLLKSIIIQIAHKQRVAVWLTEETPEDYLAVFADGIGKEVLDNIFFFCEKEHDQTQRKDKKVLTKYLKEMIDQVGSEIVFMDNITTSSFIVSKHLSEQEDCYINLNEIATDLDIAIVYVAHTSKVQKNNKRELNDSSSVRGTAQSSMQAAYIWTMNKYISEVKLTPRDYSATSPKPVEGIKSDITSQMIVKVEKCRFHKTLDKIYKLNFDFRLGWYTGDKEITYNDLKEIIKNRMEL